MLTFLTILIALLGANAEKTPKSLTPVSDASSELKLCWRTCASFNWKLVSACKLACEDTDLHTGIRLCAVDKPETVEDFTDCVQTKSQLGGAYSPSEALSFVGGYLAYIPAPSYVRNAFGAFGELIESGVEVYEKQTKKISNSVARLTGQTPGLACYRAEHPLFTLSGLTPLTQRGVISFLNPLSQYVVFSETAVCDGKKLVFPSGDSLPAKGVALVKGPRCGWSMAPPVNSGASIAVFMNDNCDPLGHGLVSEVQDMLCVHTATHVLKKSTTFTYRTLESSISKVVQTTELKWIKDGDYAYVDGCDPLPPVKPGGTCVLMSYASGMGLTQGMISVQSQIGAGTFGSVEQATPAGTSGAPCFGVAGTVSLVSAVVYGGVELIPSPSATDD
jgi:hypothetical protein